MPQKFGREMIGEIQMSLEINISPLVAVLLFFVPMFSQPALSAQSSDVQMVGSIDNRYGITMTLHINGNNVVGDYTYIRVGKPLRLQGTLSATGSLALKE